MGSRPAKDLSLVLLLHLAFFAWACGPDRTTRQRLDALEKRSHTLEATLEELQARQRGSLTPTAKRPPFLVPAEPVYVGRLPAIGKDSAKLAIIEFLDFQCPYCQRYVEETWPVILREQVETGKLKYYSRQLPLENLHPLAVNAARAATCAFEQGRFWEMRDRLFSLRNRLNLELLRNEAQTLDLNRSTFASCLKADNTILIQDRVAATDLGIHSTPTFLIGKISSIDHVRVVRRIMGAQPYPIFKSILDLAVD